MIRFSSIITGLLLSFSLISCGGNGIEVGDLRLAVAIDGDVGAGRNINVTFDVETRAVTIGDLSITFGDMFLVNDAVALQLLGGAVGFLFGDQGEIAAVGTFAEENFNQLSVLFANANLNVADAAGDPAYEGNTIRLSGTIDFDGDPLNGEETILNIRIPTPADDVLTFNETINIVSGEERNVNLLVNLETLLATVDFAPLEPVDGELVIDATLATEITTIQNNFANAFSLLVQ